MSDGDRHPTLPTRTCHWSAGDDPSPLLEREWLVTNAIGGYASGTLGGVATRRYHGLLVAALPQHGRTVMLGHVVEELWSGGAQRLRLGGEERPDALEVHAADRTQFALEQGLPVWRFTFDGGVLEKRVLMPQGQNTVLLDYRLVEGREPFEIFLRPSISFRPHDAAFDEALRRAYRLSIAAPERYEIECSGFPPLRLFLHGRHAALVLQWRDDARLHHRTEAARGYGAVAAVLRPGYFRAELSPAKRDVTLVASTESWERALALSPPEAFASEGERRRRVVDRAGPAAQDPVVAQLVLAADTFLVTPTWREHGLARSRALGLDYRSVIAGYHWFTDWGRDTMIALEGLTLATGRHSEARDILWTFAAHVRDGLIPNLFPEGAEDGLYHTADATLWFFHAVDRYFGVTGDPALVRELLPALLAILRAHLGGTRFGIGVDPADGLLRQGAEGYQLTWMDAKVGDWVVTPRRGKAVEINALWHNALCLYAEWARAFEAPGADEIAAAARRTRHSFNERFWYAGGSHLYDVIDGPAGDDAACRPNQVFAIALRHPVLDRQHWQAVMDVVERELLTPVGLRSLAPGHADYKAQYFGDLKARDAAYHQGTVWAWLIGPYLDAWLKLHPEDLAGARRQLQGLVDHLGEAGLGSVSEIFDSQPPFMPRGCIAQAWSVAELLRCWLRTQP